jgi:MFS transporter, SP family, sugar:H+ symporter
MFIRAGTTFFKNSGISDPFLITIATSVVNVGMTIPGMIAVDRLGRRRLMIYGGVAMAICQLLVAVIGLAVNVDNASGQKALVALVCIYIAHFAAIWGPFA